MKTEIKTNTIMVLEVSASGAKVAANGGVTWIDWDTLHAAAVQEDRELRDLYRRILGDAESIAADGPVIVSVGQDDSNVWFSAGVVAAWGGGRANYTRLATDGGTHPNQMLAAAEAADICDRLGSRVIRREGFDGEAARRKIAAILAR